MSAGSGHQAEIPPRQDGARPDDRAGPAFRLPTWMIPRLSLSSRNAALSALLAGLALTVLLAWQTADRMRADTELHFRSYADQVTDDALRRITQAEHGLRGARAAIRVHGRMTSAEFRAWVASLDLDRQFPGIRGFGWMEQVARRDLPAFEARVRAEQGPGFRVHGIGEEDPLLIVIHIEPRERNRPAWGLDSASNPLRQAAAQRAIDSGEATLTPPITLVQDDARRPGWLMFLPVYRDGETPPSEDRRRAGLLGLLYAPIVVGEVLAPLRDFAAGEVQFQLYDGHAKASAPLFDSRTPAELARLQREPEREPAFEEVRGLVIGDRAFSLRIASARSREAGSGSPLPVAVLVAGAALSALLALAIWASLRSRDRAEAHGRLLSADLQRLAKVVERTSSAVAELDASLTLKWVNEGFSRATGRPARECLGQPVDALLQLAEGGDDLRDRLLQAVHASGNVRLELLHVRPGGEPCWLDAEVQPQREAGEIRGFFLFGLDITALKQAQEAAQQASAAKTQFLSNMSHEIRTPMNAVIGMLALLRLTTLDRRQADYAGKAEAAAQSLLSLLNDILDFSKIEAGKMNLDPRPFAVRKLLDDLEVILSANLGDKPIALKFELDPAMPPWLLGDDMRLRQILINLGGNAIKFTLRGEVVLRVNLLRAEAEAVELELSVTDTGIGIPPQDQQRIFADFSQAAACTTRQFGGTGLGLGICSRLAALMGTRLQVESEPGRGSRFHFRLRLPRAVAPATPPALPGSVPATDRPLRGLRLLVAEDNPINQQVARELLEAAGAEVLLAANGREAVLAVAGEGPFDAVLMDVQMPVLDGFEATRQIRQRLRQAALPILAMTANALDSDREQCLAAGMNDHVGKPFVPAMLVDTILRHARPERGAAAEPPMAAPAAAAEPPMPAPAAAAATLDRASALVGLGGDERLYRRLVPLFRAELASAREQLGRFEQLPRPDLTRMLHTLKSTAATVGAQQLAAVAARGERASQQVEGLDAALAGAVSAAIVATLAALDAHETAAGGGRA